MGFKYVYDMSYIKSGASHRTSAHEKWIHERVGGATYYFRSRSSRYTFLSDAPKYQPQLGGYCVTSMARGRLADIDPDRVVAIGAALQADILIGNKRDDEMLLLDVIPLSLGIEIMGGMVEKIIPRNVTIPVAKAQEFTTFKDGQTAMAIHVVQGERELVSDCRSLARFELRGIPPMVAGAARIRVTFQVDADGLLSVAAREQTTGVESSVTVKPSYGLSDDEIADMLRDSMAHAKDDAINRALKEAQVEAQRMIEATEAALKEDPHLLSAAEATKIAETIEKLRVATAGDNRRLINLAMDDLGFETQEFAHRRMNQSVNRALAGRKVADIKLGEEA